MTEIIYIIKIGGNVIDDQTNLQSFLKEFSSINNKKILVHGGGKIATAIGDKLNIQSKYIDGRRITDDETIDLVTMVYGGLVNKKIVATLQSLQCNAIGLSGADANVLPAKKRPVKTIDFVPVVAPLTHDQQGHLLNTNADTMAAVLSVALSKLYDVQLIYCFEKNGVLTDVNDAKSVITELETKFYNKLKEEKKLFAGILPKIDNAFDAVKNGVNKVIIGNSNDLLRLVKGESGTKINS